MDFRIATSQDTPQVEALWAYCFEPKEDPFFQYIFLTVMNQRILL